MCLASPFCQRWFSSEMNTHQQAEEIPCFSQENTLEIIGSRIRGGLLAENDGVEK